jgi:hypothetical protein
VRRSESSIFYPIAYLYLSARRRMVTRTMAGTRFSSRNTPNLCATTSPGRRYPQRATTGKTSEHWLNMELDLQSLFGLCVNSCTHWLRPCNPPPPHLGSYTGALLVSHDRRHLFVTPLISIITLHEELSNGILKLFIKKIWQIFSRLDTFIQIF